MLRSSSCDYSGVNTLVSGTITVQNITMPEASDNRKNTIIQNCAPFTDCISEIDNTQLGTAKEINIVMPMYNLIEYSGNYYKISGSLWW